MRFNIITADKSAVEELLMLKMINTFGKNIIPDNDQARIVELERYKVLNTSPEESFDRIVSLVAKIFNVPISLISFVSDHEVFFKANYGFGNARKASRGESLCALAILEDQTTVFENTLDEPCLLANPNVTKHGVKFYAGAPLKTPEGYHIGTLCIIDYNQRYFYTEQIKMLEEFALLVMDLLALRKSLLLKENEMF